MLHTFHGASQLLWFGRSAAGAGDVDGDGHADLIVGAPSESHNGPSSGSAHVFSGATGQLLYRVDGAVQGEQIGWSVGAGTDGFAGPVVGAMYAPHNGPDSGRVRVYSSCLPLGTTYCSPGVANSTGAPAAIRACGSDLLTDRRFLLSAADLPPGRFGCFLLSDARGLQPGFGGSQGTLCLSGWIGRFASQVRRSETTGSLAIVVDLASVPTSPPGPVLVGETWCFQAWYRDEHPGPTSNFSDAVAVTYR